MHPVYEPPPTIGGEEGLPALSMPPGSDLAVGQNGCMSATGPTAPEILIFATGGTIGMRETDAGLAPDPDFPEALDALVASICEPFGTGWRINHLHPPIDSANANEETGPRIARAIRARMRAHPARGVVVTHGTDTLAFTAARLAFELANLDAPVVVTGSHFPHGAEGGDARSNLALAIRTAVLASREAPACVAFGGALVPAVRTRKHDSSAIEAFRAESEIAADPRGLPPAPATMQDPEQLATRSIARILSFRFVPGVTADDLLAAVGGGPDGLVLECYGSGTGPVDHPGMQDALRRITDAMPVVAVSQCAKGGIDFARYATGSALAATGVIDGSDLTVEAATAKLGYLLDSGHHWNSGDREGFRALMGTNLIGECRTVERP